MYNTILVPLDGSKLAEQALPLAVSIAKRAGAALRLTQVHQRGDGQDPNAVKNGGRSYLEAVARNAKTMWRVPSDIALLDGAVVPALCKYVEQINANLMVLTTHGRGLLSRFWLGSTTDELVRHTPVPLLIYRPDPNAPPSADFRFYRIVVPLDGSDVAEEAIGPAAEMARIMDAGLTFLRVVEPVAMVAPDGLIYTPPVLDTAFTDDLAAQAEQYVDHIAARWQGEGLKVETRVAVNDVPTAAILEAAARHDLIALATHGRSRIARLFLGSVADKVVRGAACPVLVVRHPHTRPEGVKP